MTPAAQDLRPRGGRLLRLPWVFMGAVGLVVAYLATAPLAGRRDGDFIHFWVAGRLAARGGGAALYDQAAQLTVLREAFPGDALPAWGVQEEALGLFLYPPWTALLYAPAGLLPLRAAATVQAVMTVLMGLASAWLLRGLLADLGTGRSAHLSPWALVLLIFLYPPFFYNFVVGQNAAWALVALLGWAWLARRGHPFWAGVALGALAFKPSWLLVLGWLPLASRHWRALAGMGVAVATLVLPTWWWLGVDPLRDYLALMPDIAALSELSNYRLHLQYSGVGLFRRLLASPWAEWLAGATSLALVGASFTLIWRASPRGFDIRLVALGLLAGLWSSPHLHHYDVLLSVVAAALLVIALIFLVPAVQSWLLPLFWFLAKTGALLLLFIWVRGTLPRYRYDQLMKFGWTFLFPVSIANLFATALLVALFGT